LLGEQIRNTALKVDLSKLNMPAFTAEAPLSELEALFTTAGVIDLPEMTSMERHKGRLSEDDEDEDEDEDDPSSRMRSAVTGSNARAPRNIRHSSKNDDSDFEFDL
jgi:hypothetical protein